MSKRNNDRDGLYRRKDSPSWWASYTDASGRRTRCSTGTGNRKEAEALLAKWRLEAYRGKQWDEQPSRTFDELMIAYLDCTQGEKRAPRRDLNSLQHLYPVFSGCDLNTLTTVDLRRYIAQRKSEGAAASTINKEVGLISSAANYARREWGWEIPNPAVQCKQREPEGRVRWLRKDEYRALMAEAAQSPKATHLPDFIRLAVNTACRKGELLGLEWNRVDLKTDLIWLEGQHTKAGKRRSVPLNRGAREALLHRAAFRAQHCPDSPWVFAHKNGNRIQDVRTSFLSACRRAKIKDFRIHDLRHTCAAWLVSEGVPLTEVRELLGHSSVQMTERYAHLAPERVRSAVGRLDGHSSRSGHAERTA